MTRDNLSFSLTEVNIIKNTDSEPDLSWMAEFKQDSICTTDEVLSKELLLELEFNEYNLKELIKFCDYYKIFPEYQIFLKRQINKFNRVNNYDFSKLNKFIQ